MTARDAHTGCEQHRTAVPVGALVLLVDHDERHLETLGHTLRQRGLEVRTCNAAMDAQVEYVRYRPDAVVVDLSMPALDGLEVLSRLRGLDANAGIILISAHLDVPTTVRALRLGADDVLAKPLEIPTVLAALTRTIARVRDARLQRAFSLHREHAEEYFDDSPLMGRAFRAIQLAATADYSLLLRGEPGTGKACAARLVHALSARSDSAFVLLDCAAPLEELLADLAVDADCRPTGAPSLVDRAEGGTLCIVEPHALPPMLQPVLVAALDRRDSRSGEGRMPSGVRVVATTTSLPNSAADRVFTSCAHYRRIAEIPVTLPPLRARGGGAIRTLATRILQRQQAAVGQGPTRFTSTALELLERHAWPGNVRELRYVVGQAFLLSLDSPEIDVGALPSFLFEQAPHDAVPGADSAEVMTLDTVERRHIVDVLRRVGGNRAAAARLLGISRSTLYAKIAAHGLDLVATSTPSGRL